LPKQIAQNSQAIQTEEPDELKKTMVVGITRQETTISTSQIFSHFHRAQALPASEQAIEDARQYGYTSAHGGLGMLPRILYLHRAPING